MLEDVAGIVDALQDVNVEISGPAGYDPGTLGLGMTGVDGLGLEAFRASVVLVARASTCASRSRTRNGEGRRELVPRGNEAAAQDGRQHRRRRRRGAPGAPSPPSDDDARRLRDTLNARQRAPRDGGEAATAAPQRFSAAVERESAALMGAFERTGRSWRPSASAGASTSRSPCSANGKDRTGMAATLAAAAFCGEFGRDNEPQVLATANLLRAHGTRIRICEKNTGRRRYAFNAFQREFLPAPFRPPPSTIEDLASSLIHRDMS